MVEITPTGTIASDAGISLRMGNYAQDASRTFDGIIDDVRICDRLPSAGEVAFIAAEGGGSGTYLDEFNAIVYNGNDGTLDWSSDWQEVSESDGPSSGILRVLSNARCANSNCIRIGHSDIEDQPTKALVREADLGSATTATFSYDYEVQNVDNKGTVLVRISGDGGSNWTTLATYTISSGSGSESFDISTYVASNTQISIEVTGKYAFYVFIDKVRIDVDGGGGGGGGSCDATFRDEFNAVSYSGNDGTQNWAGPWAEINESGSVSSGDERVDDNDSDFHLRVRDNDGGGEGVQREADLSDYTAATLSFDYRRNGFDNANDYVMVHVSGDGGGSCTELDRFLGPGTDSNYVSVSYDISNQIATNTRIRFLTSPDHGSGDEMYIDNVEIAVSGCANP